MENRSADVFGPVKALVIFGCLLLAVCAGCQSPGPIPNRADVAPSIIRGGQPTTNGWAQLRAGGITNVVKLNLGHSDQEAERLGMTVHQFPINLCQQLFGVNRSTVCKAADAITPGSYIHCSHGQDRTGLVVAKYRLRSGWTKAEAEKEMLAHGFHKMLFGLWNYWREYNPTANRAIIPAGAKD